MQRLLILALLLASTTAFGQLNTTSDDYAAAFRTKHDGTMELWFTSSRVTREGRSRAVYVADCDDTGFANIHVVDAPINYQPASGTNGIALDGTPAFVGCNGNFGAFTSNRMRNGRYSGNDIYQIQWDGSRWVTTPMDALNSDYWDDSPSFNSDGTRIYFSSDRRFPGTRRADLYMCENRDGQWSEPVPLIELNTAEFSEETPYVGPDGYLYYSTNRDGDFDIWRTKLDANGLPQGIGEPVAGVNKKGSDQTHPMMSPGGHYFLYSTNDDSHGGRGDLNIVWVRLTSNNTTLHLDVRKRYRQWTKRIAITMKFKSLGSEKDWFTTLSDSGQIVDVPVDNILGLPKSPGADRDRFTILATATPDSARFVAAIDTLVGSRTCTDLLPHTIFLWDTSTYYAQSCTDTFPIKNVQYFVTGYWCPTTSRYAAYMNCPTLFVDSACLHPVCPPTDLYSYHVDVNRAHSECIDYKEFDERGAKFSAEVDDAIEQHLKAMESAFESACMRRTIAEHHKVRVVIEGFTDPRGYRYDCHYFGPSIDFANSFVQVPDEMKAHFKHDARMKDYGAQGNQLLSELRAYNLAVLLDNLWTERIPQYRSLKESGLLSTIAIGKAISQDQIPFDQRRSAVVSVEADDPDVIIRSQTPPPGRRVILCTSCQQQ